MLRLVCSAALGVALAGAARADDGIKPGEPYKGEMTKEKISVEWIGLVVKHSSYGVELPIKLSSGQKVSFVAKVAGTNRTVAIGLNDPTGKPIASTGRFQGTQKQATLTVPEVSATGTYTIVVLSDGIGDFTLTVTGPSTTELDAKALEAEIAELKALLAKKEAALKALKAKKP